MKALLVALFNVASMAHAIGYVWPWFGSKVQTAAVKY